MRIIKTTSKTKSNLIVHFALSALIFLSTAGSIVPVYAEGNSSAGQQNTSEQQSKTEPQSKSKQPGMTAAEEADAVGKAMTESLKELLSEYYSKIKITQKGNKIHFEYKVRPFAGVGGKESLVPDLGGIMGDLQIVDGEYAGKMRLPQQFNEHAQYSIILMAPYSAKHDCHLYTRLSYPYDVVPEFLERFKEVANKFSEVTESVATIKPPKNVASGSGSNSTKAGSGAESSSSASNTTGSSGFSSAGRSSSTGSSAAASSGSSGSNSGSSSSTATSGENVAGSTTSGSANDKIKLTMWKMKKGTQTIYLLGTIPYHAADKSFYPLSPEIEAALDQSKQLLVDSVDIKKTLPITDKRIYGAPADKLSSHLSASTREALDKYLAWSGDSLDMYEIFKPWFASVAMDHSVTRLTGFQSTKLKEHLMNKAKSSSKPVVELESADTRIKVLDSLPNDVQDKMLRNSISSLMNYQDEQSQLEDAWRAGSENAVRNVSLSPSKKDTGLVGVFEDIVTEQNNGVSSRIEELSKSNSPLFVAMDSRRMVGESGLVALLKKGGYTSEQMAGSSPNQALASTISKNELEADFGAARMQRFTYPEGRFSILLPGKPTMNFSNVDGQRRVDYTYKDPQGAMFVGYIITPGVVPRAALPTVLFKIATSLSQKYGAKETKQYAINVAGHPGRQIDFISAGGQVGKDIRLRLIVAGSFVYIIGAEGTSPWVKSPGVKQFFDSLAIAPAASGRTASRFGTPFGFGQPIGTPTLNQQFIDLMRKQQEKLRQVPNTTPSQQTFPSQQTAPANNYKSNRPWGQAVPSNSRPWGQGPRSTSKPWGQ